MTEPNPSGPLDPLVRDLVEWIETGPKPYAEVMDAWRTSCPRLTVWEDAVELGLVRRERKPGEGDFVKITDRGRQHLAQSRH